MKEANVTLSATQTGLLGENSAPVEFRDDRRMGGVTLRVVMLSLFLAAVFGFCIPIVDYKMSNTFLGAAHLPAAAVAVLMVMLLVVNPLLKMLSARAAFSRNEVLVVYISCLFSSLVPGRGGENFFIPNLVAPFYYATTENKWLTFLQPYLKPWFTPALNADGTTNTALVAGWFEGTGGEIPWGAWLVPLAVWGTMILVLYIMQGCLGSMLRAQWAQREALTFPLLKLPLEMTEDVDEPGAGIGRFLKNPIMWVGFGIAVFIEMMNGLSLYFPDVPPVPLRIDSGPLFTEAPWNQIGGLQIQVYPAVLGLAFLLTTEVSFSLAFFHLFSKFQLVIAYMLGFMPAAMESPFWTRGWAKGFIGYQQVGAYLGFVGLLLWTGREHWKHIAMRAIGREKATEAERGEALSYPVAFWGFFLSLAVLVGWTIAAGVKPSVAFLMWGAYLVVALGLARVVAEAGLMFVHTGWMTLGPIAFLFGGGPGRIIDPVSAVPGSIISSSFMLEMRGFLLPSFVQGFKLAHDRKIPLKPMLALIAVSTLISFAIGIFMIISMGYDKGGLQLQAWWARNTFAAVNATSIARGVETNLWGNWGWVGAGIGMTWLMMAARSRFAWFPFHPIGLLMCLPFAMNAMWLSIGLGCLAKVLITRFGGSDSYRKAVPLFLGIALGDIMMCVFWVCIDGWQGKVGHALLPF